MNHWNIRIVAFILLSFPLGLSLTGCKKKEESQVAPPPEVEVVTIDKKDVPVFRDWVGSVEADVNATITAQVTGYLLSRNYEEGKPVTNGQVLFQIDKAPFEAALAKAKAQVTQAMAQREKFSLDVQRYRPLAEKEAISKQELDDAIQNERAAQGQVEAAQAAAEQANLNLAFTTIRSPVDGLAGLAKAQVGDLVGPASGQLTTVARVEPARVYFSVSQQLLSQMQEKRLAEGQAALRAGEGPELEVVLASGTVYPIKGRVRFANNQVDVKTGTITVVGEFANPQMLLVPGMFVRVRALLSTQKDALVAPQRSVADMQGRSLVAVVGPDDKVKIVPVTTGEPYGSLCVVTGNIKAGDRLVAEGLQKVKEGELVKPVPFAEKPGQAGSSSPARSAAK
jgi:membrane fusion protein (multidrug efflux system)